MTHIISIIKDMLDRINSRLDEAENQISDLEDKVTNHPIRIAKRKKNNEDILRDL